MAFIFYDTETTGTNVHFDQILQFAAIKTDDALNEIDRFEIRCRLLPHILASPGAMNVTGVTVDQLTDPSLPSCFDMACAIREKLLSWQPAIFIGHNSLDFDEKLLRSLFYKSLLPIYLTNIDGNSRLDTRRLMESAFIFEGDGLVFPENGGRPVFKLDLLAPANGHNHANAHDAMADVEATLHLCRRVRDSAPETWSRFMRFSNKSAVKDFCETEDLFGFSAFYGGRPYTYIVSRIGNHPTDLNEIYVFDLALDPQAFEALDHEALCDRIGASPKPTRKFRANGLPDLSEWADAHPISRVKDVDQAVLEARAQYLIDHPDLCERLVTAMVAVKADYPPSPHVEENIYAGFASPHDQAVMEDFHDADWPQCEGLLANFEDERFRLLGEQILYVEAPDHLSVDRREFWQRRFAERLLGAGDECKALTCEKALEEAVLLIDGAEGRARARLIAHRDRVAALNDELREMAAGWVD